MRINEFTDGLKRFVATVRVKGNSATMTVKTSVEAEGQAQARAMLCRIYGDGNVQTVMESGALLDEADSVQTPNPDSARLKAVSDQAKRARQAEQKMKAQEALKKAQERMTKVQQSDPALLNKPA